MNDFGTGVISNPFTSGASPIKSSFDLVESLLFICPGEGRTGVTQINEI